MEKTLLDKIVENKKKNFNKLNIKSIISDEKEETKVLEILRGII